MARLFSYGGEWSGVGRADAGTPGCPGPNGLRLKSSTVTFDAANGRLGIGSCIDCTGGVSNVSTFTVEALFGRAGSVGTSYFFRWYFRFSGNPTDTSTYTGLSNATSNDPMQVRLTTAGRLQVICGVYTGATSDVLAIDTWHRVDVKVIHNASVSSATIELLVNDVQVSITTTATARTVYTTLSPGIQGTSGTDRTHMYDDIAVNDSTGSSDNSYPPDSKILHILPISNNSVGNWKSGTGTSATNDGNQWDAINNDPPGGTATPNATTVAIGNNVSGASSAGIGKFDGQTYADAGVPAGSTINFVQMVIGHSEDASTGTKTGTFGFASNPTQGTMDNVAADGSSQFGAGGGGACLTYGASGSLWRTVQSTPQYNPSLTLSSSPVLQINKTDTGTRYANCNFIGAIVDFVPGAATADLANLYMRRQYSPLLAQ